MSKMLAIGLIFFVLFGIGRMIGSGDDVSVSIDDTTPEQSETSDLPADLLNITAGLQNDLPLQKRTPKRANKTIADAKTEDEDKSEPLDTEPKDADPKDADLEYRPQIHR
jgi:hypothetical protein